MIRLTKPAKGTRTLWTGGYYGNAESSGHLRVVGTVKFPLNFARVNTSGRTTGHTEYERVVAVGTAQTYKADDDWWDRWRWWPVKADVTYNSLTIAERAEGDCIRPGDSGGAVYQALSFNGRPAAKVGGIISGSSEGDGRCWLIFTPIQYVKQDVGGRILKAKR